MKLGEYLLQRGTVTAADIAEALAEQRQSGKRLGNILMTHKKVSEDAVAAFLEKRFDSEVKRLAPSDVRRESLALMPEDFIRRNHVLPFTHDDAAVQVLMPDIRDQQRIEEIRFLTERTVIAHLGLEYHIDGLVNTLLGVGGSMDNIVRTASDIPAAQTVTATAAADDDDSSASRIVQLLMTQAVAARASDVHIELFRDRVFVRCRIDGVLAVREAFPAAVYPNVISRIKVLSRLDIAEKRLPQDGKYTFTQNGKPTDIRVSIIPTVYGENAVLRILSQHRDVFALSALGYTEDEITLLTASAMRTQGLVLITGPTGSGKSTTLYSLIDATRDNGRKIITIEDPVEYALDGIMQIQVNEAIGLTFPAALKRVLRHDPNTILIGEIRDETTASIAANAALTGHLVFGTLHTNSAPATVTRLREMAVNDYLISEVSSLFAAQRLVRLLCPSCKVKDGAEFTHAQKPCDACGGSGYRGRTVIAEFLPIDDEIRTILQNRGDTDRKLRDYMRAKKLPSLYERGMAIVREGKTSRAEIMRVAGPADGI
ncbi:MAG: Flp pilus assembly complex ATPase component TadA [Spirochaetes bacterium]|nr:Flp pilus assembly complex ATPase component TadA [Spirochaetota bacterium]